MGGSSRLHSACEGLIQSTDYPSLADHRQLLLAGGMHPDTGATVIVPAALFTAVRDRYFDIVKLLLFHGADVNYHNFDYHCGFEDAIHVAAANGDAQMITLLAVYRADLESVMPENVYGGTPLQIAAPRGHVRAVKALLKLGAYVDQGDAFGATALEKVESMAVQVRYESDMWESMIEIAEILVKAGAYVSHTKRSVAQMCACPNLRVAGEFQGILLALKMRLVDGGM